MENGVFFSFKLSISVYLYWEDEKKDIECELCCGCGTIATKIWRKSAITSSFLHVLNKIWYPNGK